MSEKFDFEAALKAVQSGQAITGKDGVLGPLVKQLTEVALEAELDSHLAKDVAENRRNGKSRKTVKSTSGKFELETPRDRAGTFEPQLVKKHQRTVSDEIESKILSMYGLGMSYADISGHVEEMYGISVSTAAISTITDKLIAEVKAWQARPLENLYPFVWLDAIHYKIRDKGRLYRARSLGEAEAALDELESAWGEKYPIVIKSWRTKWQHLSAYFKYPEDIRRIIYTTNSIEAVHRQFRKLTKTKGGFPNNDSLLKLLFMGIQNASKKWTMPIQNWNLTLSQLSIFFEGRLDAALEF